MPSASSPRHAHSLPCSTNSGHCLPKAPFTPPTPHQPPILYSIPELLGPSSRDVAWGPSHPSLTHSDSFSGTNSSCIDRETEAQRGFTHGAVAILLLGHPSPLPGTLQTGSWRVLEVVEA